MFCACLKVTYLLWDTAGQEEYDAITRAYYKALERESSRHMSYIIRKSSPCALQGAGACILAFSTTDRDSFDAIESWYKKALALLSVVVCAISLLH